MNRLCPAETRLKEGAGCTQLRPNRWEYSLAAGGGRPGGALLGSIEDGPLRCQTIADLRSSFAVCKTASATFPHCRAFLTWPGGYSGPGSNCCWKFSSDGSIAKA